MTMLKTASSNAQLNAANPSDSRREALAALRAEFIASCNGPQWREKTLTRTGIRLFGLLYASSSPVLQRIRSRRGGSWKVLVEYSPLNLGTIKVQQPRGEKWLIVPCVDREYAEGLSLQVHNEIRRHLRKVMPSIKECDAVMLRRAKAEMDGFIENLRQK